MGFIIKQRGAAFGEELGFGVGLEAVGDVDGEEEGEEDVGEEDEGI